METIKQWHERTSDLSGQQCMTAMKAEIADLRAALAKLAESAPVVGELPQDEWAAFRKLLTFAEDCFEEIHAEHVSRATIEEIEQLGALPEEIKNARAALARRPTTAPSLPVAGQHNYSSAETVFNVLAPDHQEKYSDLTSAQREIYECVARAVLSTAKAPNGSKGYKLVRSIIHQCQALALPQTFIQKIGMTAQIIPLKGMSDEDAQQLVDDCNGYAPVPAAAPAGLTDAQRIALLHIKEAVKVNDSDTLSGMALDTEVLWWASGSWSGPASVTLGDLRAIATLGAADGAKTEGGT